VKEKQFVDDKLPFYLAIDDDISFDFITIKNIVLQHVKDNFFETIRISTHYNSVTFVYFKTDFIANIFEIF